MLFKHSLVVHVLCLADGALDLSRLFDVDVGLDAHHRHDAVVERLDVWHLLRRVGREELAAQLDVEVEGVFVVLAVNGDEILCGEGGELGEAGLYLTREHVDAAYDHHVV